MDNGYKLELYSYAHIGPLTEMAFLKCLSIPQQSNVTQYLGIVENAVIYHLVAVELITCFSFNNVVIHIPSISIIHFKVLWSIEL